MSQRTYELLQHPLLNSDTIDHLWVVNATLLCLGSDGKHLLRCWRHRSLYWQQWCFLPFMGWSYCTTAHHINQVARQLVHNQSTQVWMGSQGDWLARLLANTHWTKTMEKENRGSAKNAASNNPQTITRIYWNGQLLQEYVATQVAHLSTTYS